MSTLPLPPNPLFVMVVTMMAVDLEHIVRGGES